MPMDWARVAVAVAVAGGCAAAVWSALPSRADVVGGEQALHPHEHFSVGNPGDLSKTDAIRTYNGLVETMARRYAPSGETTAQHYRRWRRYNDAPYRSETHGNRYVNNYANPIAERAGYGDLEPGTRMPPGAILAKDSFTYTADRKVFPGALFVMEKLAAGVSPATADWRYVMILPDGTVFGDSAAGTSEAVDFCHACHEQRAEFDHLFFVPEGYRATPATE